MKVITVRLASATLLAAALASSPTSFAQAPAGESTPNTGPASEASPMFQRHYAMAGIMKDMVREMSRMQEEMGRGDSTPEMRRQFEEMRRQTDEMSRSHSMSDPAISQVKTTPRSGAAAGARGDGIYAATLRFHAKCSYIPVHMRPDENPNSSSAIGTP